MEWMADINWLSVLFVSIGAILLLVGYIGCFLPVINGPLVSYCALLLLLCTPMSPGWVILLVCGCITIFAIAMDYVMPMIGAHLTKSSWQGRLGCFIGIIVGLFFLPWGLILGPFLGAVIGELIARRALGKAMISGVGAVVGLLLGAFLKLFCCGLITLCFIWCIGRNPSFKLQGQSADAEQAPQSQSTQDAP